MTFTMFIRRDPATPGAAGPAVAGRPSAARRRGRRGLAALAGAALLLSGCVSMPRGGEVQRVDPGQRSEGDSQVRVFGVSPQDGAPPEQIVRGFLEAVTSDEAEFATARDYLTPEARESWDPHAGVSVLMDGPGPPGRIGEFDEEGETATFEVGGTRLAFIDDRHGYTPAGQEYQADFELRRVEEEWRIDALPDGLILGEQDFRRMYRSVSTYFYAYHGRVGSAVADARNVLVADPVYLRHQVDPVGDAVDALLSGPSGWLEPVVRSQFPDGARVARGTRPVIDEEGVLTVRLSGLPQRISDQHCDRMAAQLFHTLRDLGPTELTEVRLGGRVGTTCTLTAREARTNAPGLLIGEQDRQYFIGEDHRLMVVGDDQAPRAVGGPLGRGEVALRSAAVRRDEERAAAVSADGVALYLDDLSGDGPLEEAAYVSAAGGPEGGISPPSWDGLGDLWFADRDPQDPRLLRMSGGTGAPQPIDVDGLRPGQRIEALRVASDGVRIALLVSEDGRTTLRLGRIERATVGERLFVRVAQLRPIAPHLENVVAVSWAGGSRLVVVGRPEGGAEQMSYVNTDGSTVNASKVAAPSEVTGLAASEQDEHPLLAQSGEGIARQHRDGTWLVVGPDGTAPAYPG